MRRKYLLKEREITTLGILLVVFISIILAPYILPQVREGGPGVKNSVQENFVGRAIGSCITPADGETVIIAQDSVLCKGEYKNVTINITANMTTFDCGDSSFFLYSTINPPVPSKGITIRNCHFYRPVYRLAFPKARDLLLENIEVVNSLDDGIHIDPDAGGNTNTLRNVTVNRTAGKGIDFFLGLNGMVGILDRVTVIGSKGSGIYSADGQVGGKIVLSNVVSCFNVGTNAYDIEVNKVIAVNSTNISCQSSESHKRLVGNNWIEDNVCTKPCPPELNVTSQQKSPCWDPEDAFNNYDFSRPGITICPGEYSLPFKKARMYDPLSGISYTNKWSQDQVIDCNGATIRESAAAAADPPSAGLAFSKFDVTRPTGIILGNVLIRNCVFEGFDSGILIPTTAYAYQCPYTCMVKRYNITIENVTFLGNKAGVESRTDSLVISGSTFVRNKVAVNITTINNTLVHSTFVDNILGVNINNLNDIITIQGNNGYHMPKNDRFLGKGQGNVLMDNAFIGNRLDVSCAWSFHDTFTDNDCNTTNTTDCCKDWLSTVHPCMESDICGKETPLPPTPPAPTCGDHLCNGQENCTTCPVDCGTCTTHPTCGDGVCNGQESADSCPVDCFVPGSVCGDGICNAGENTTCPQDCAGTPGGTACVPVPEICDNHIDDDCDGLIDHDDPDCSSANTVTPPSTTPSTSTGTTGTHTTAPATSTSGTGTHTTSPTTQGTGTHTTTPANTQSTGTHATVPTSTAGTHPIQTSPTNSPTNHPALPAETSVKKEFSKGIIQGKATSADAIVTSTTIQGPQGTIYAFTAKEAVKDTSLLYTGGQQVEVYKQDNGAWKKVPLTQGAVKGQYIPLELGAGEYAIVETSAKASTASTSTASTTGSEPVVEKPTSTGFPLLPVGIVIGIVILIAGFFIMRHFRSIEDVQHAAPLRELQESVRPNETRTFQRNIPREVVSQRHKAKMLLETELLKGRSIDDAKLELIKQGFDPKIINDAMKELKK